MVRSGLLKKFVLVVTIVYTSVRSLETGYRYTNEHVEPDELNKDLKCGYLFCGYTLLRLVRTLHGSYNTELKLLFGTISVMNNVVKSQLISLFGLRVLRVGAMWALHLFTGLIVGFYQDSRNTRANHPKVIDTLGYVIERLHDDLAGCRKGNSYDSYESALKSSRTFGFYSFSKTILPRYLEQAKAQLDNNNIITDPALMEKLDLSLRSNSLLLHNLGMYNTLKNDLQNVYNVKMKWNNTSATLYTAWKNARALDWKNTNLRHIKSYYDACYDFLKIIIYRLTSKHMEYLRPYVDDEQDFGNYARQWCDIVVRFGIILNLSEDLHVKNLLHVLENLINGVEKIDSVVSYIAVKLVKLCQPFGCEASDPVVLDDQEFKIQYTGLTEEETKSLQVTNANAVRIEYNSLANATTFLSHLKLIFEHVNLSAIRSLTNYVDKLNPTNRVERSEYCAEELEHLINISDYD